MGLTPFRSVSSRTVSGRGSEAAFRTLGPSPLAGVKVLDLSKILAGPYATMSLADLGAAVTKVEHPDGGDPTRTWGPFVDDDATYYLAIKRGKTSVTVDLNSDDGQRTIHHMLEQAEHISGVQSAQPTNTRDGPSEIRAGAARADHRGVGGCRDRRGHLGGTTLFDFPTQSHNVHPTNTLPDHGQLAAATRSTRGVVPRGIQTRCARNVTLTRSPPVTSVTSEGTVIRQFASANEANRWVPDVTSGCTRYSPVFSSRNSC